MPSVGAVVVAYNSSTTIAACVQSCLADPDVVGVVVVDNAHEEACRKAVVLMAKADRRVRYEPSVNQGFGRGCNRGAEMLPKCEDVAFINPDVELTQRLGRLADYLHQSPAVILAGRLRSLDNPEHVNARRAVSRGRELLAACIGGDRAYAVTRTPSEPSADWVWPVDQVAGALFIISVVDYKRLNGFDERFELYYDDVDLCARAKFLGGVTLIDEEWGIHHGGRSAATVSCMAYCVGTVSRTRYIHKYYGCGVGTRAYLVALGVLEFVVRSATRRSEGQNARVRAIRLQFREIARPGTVKVLH